MENDLTTERLNALNDALPAMLRDLVESAADKDAADEMKDLIIKLYGPIIDFATDAAEKLGRKRF